MSSLDDALAFFAIDDDEPIESRIRSGISRSGNFSNSNNSSFSAASEGDPMADYAILKHASGAERIPSVNLNEADREQWLRHGRPDLNKNLMSEAVVGSLPKPLSLEDRRAVRTNVPPSPTLDMVHGLDADFLSAKTPVAQKRRLRLLSGSVVVVICAGYSGKRFIYEKAKQLGVRMVMLDGPDVWARSLVGEGILERFEPIDFSDPEGVFDKCVAIIKAVRRDYGNVDGIVTFLDFAVPLVSRLCDSLGYPGNASIAVEVARDKSKTRRALEEGGVPTPGHFLIDDESQLGEAAAKVGFPAVLKPISGAASMGVVRVDDEAGLRDSYRRVQAELARTIYKDGQIITAEEGDGEVDAKQSKALGVAFQVMVESYLDGPEVDVDVLLRDGKMVYAHVTDNWPTEEPWFLETGSNSPSTLSPAQQADLRSMSRDCLVAMGLTHGVHHVELKYTRQGPRLIEVNPRLGGGCVRDMNLLATGVDLVEEQLIAAIGLPNNPPAAAGAGDSIDDNDYSREGMMPLPLHHVAEYSVNAPRSGVLASHDFLGRWPAHPDVVYCRALADVGDKVTSSADGLPTWVAEVMVTKASMQEAIDFVKQIVDEMTKMIVIK